MKYAFRIALILLGIYLILPSRNTFGNPLMETEIDSCRLKRSDAMVTLYEGDGGALDGPWWTITYDKGWLSFETQFLVADMNPAVMSIFCNNDTVFVNFENDSVKTCFQRAFGIDELQRLLEKPIFYFYGKERAISPVRHFGSIQLFGASILVFTLGVPLLRLVRSINSKSD